MTDDLNIDPHTSMRGVPMGILLNIDWKGDVAKRLISASVRMNRWDILLRTIGRNVVLSVRQNFDDQKSPSGDRWPGLKRPRGKGHNPLGMVLQDTYRLINSIGFAPEHPTNEVRIGYGSQAAYGRFHQEGTRFIPQRRFLGMKPTDDPGPEVWKHVVASFEGAKEE